MGKMESLFQLVKRLCFVSRFCREMAFQSEPHPNIRCEEQQGFMGGIPVRPYAAPQSHGQAMTAYGHHPLPQWPSPQCQYRLAINDNYTHRRRNRSYCCWLIVGNIVATMVITCGIVFGLLFTLKEFNSSLLCAGAQRLEESSRQRSPDGCVPCSGTSRSPGDKCCLLVDLAALRELIQTQMSSVEEEMRQNIQSGGNLSSNPSISEKCGALFHLNGKNEVSNSDAEFSIVRHWSSQGNVPYKSNCIDYDESSGSVTVTSGGAYLVYSHLAFLWTDKGSHSNIIHHRIIASEPVPTAGGNRGLRPPRPMVIASDSRAIQKDNPSVGYVPSYNSRTMVIVQLKRGTKLTVEAKPVDHLMHSNQYSSFGLFKL